MTKARRQIGIGAPQRQRRLAQLVGQIALTQQRGGDTASSVEARAERAGVLVTGPLGLCFLPAFICLGIVPVVVGLASSVLGSI